MRSDYKTLSRIGQGVLTLIGYPFSMLSDAEDTADYHLDAVIIGSTLPHVLRGEVGCLLCGASLGGEHPPARFWILRPSVEAIDMAGEDRLYFPLTVTCDVRECLPDTEKQVLMAYQNKFDLRFGARQ